MNELTVGVIGDNFADPDVMDKLLSIIEEGSVSKIGMLFFDLTTIAGKVTLDYCKRQGKKFIAGMPIDLSKFDDLKPQYDRNHEIINKSDVVLFFYDKNEFASDSTLNAMRYAEKKGACAYTVNNQKEQTEPKVGN